MGSEAMYQFLEQIEANVHSRPSPIEFEMAYQARVAIDRIKFAINHTEQFAPRTDSIQEVSLQLLDALERLESVDRRFLQRSLKSSRSKPTASDKSAGAAHLNGKGMAHGAPDCR